jgi:hypothetical protein
LFGAHVPEWLLQVQALVATEGATAVPHWVGPPPVLPLVAPEPPVVVVAAVPAVVPAVVPAEVVAAAVPLVAPVLDEVVPATAPWVAVVLPVAAPAPELELVPVGAAAGEQPSAASSRR